MDDVFVSEGGDAIKQLFLVCLVIIDLAKANNVGVHVLDMLKNQRQPILPGEVFLGYSRERLFARQRLCEDVPLHHFDLDIVLSVVEPGSILSVPRPHDGESILFHFVASLVATFATFYVAHFI